MPNSAQPNLLSPNASIAIAGGGLLGRLLAWQLLRAGFSVDLFDAGPFNPSPAAARTAAGMISPLSEAVVSDFGVYQMGLFALETWPLWLTQFRTAPDAAKLFSRRGSLVIAHPQDASELAQFSRELDYVLGDAGRYRQLSRRDIHELEPDLSPVFEQGLLLEDEGHLHNRHLLDVLLQEVEALGCRCHGNSPVDVAPGEIVRTEGRQAFDLVIDCRGTGAHQLPEKVRGVRGEVIYVQTREVQLQRPVRLMHPRYQLYIVPKPEHGFIIGATQIESEDRSPVSLQSSLELSSALYTLSPAFAEARILAMDVNLRPAFMDNLPGVYEEPGLISANGLFRHGYLLAPAVVTQVLSRLLPNIDSAFHSLLMRTP